MTNHSHVAEVQATNHHPFDFDDSEKLDLFAEELPSQQQQNLPPNSLSTLACECDISTFFCYGCGL
jgi:hypothetical protein